MSDLAKISVGMMGTGEYTTGFVGGGQSTSDKKVSWTHRSFPIPASLS